MLQEENENILEKVCLFFCSLHCSYSQWTCYPMFIFCLIWISQLRLAEESCEAAEARVKELEKQVMHAHSVFVYC